MSYTVFFYGAVWPLIVASIVLAADHYWRNA